MKIKVNTTLFAGTSSDIEIEGIKDFSEVKEWFVKWDTFHYTLDEENWKEIEMNSESDCTDWKRPLSVEIFDEKNEKLAEDGN